MLDTYNPLPPDHPAIGDICWKCEKPIQAGSRTTLMPIETRDQTGSYTVEAKVVHATCKYRGWRVKTPEGERIIDRIKDGDASPYPVLTTDGRQWKLEEITCLAGEW